MTRKTAFTNVHRVSGGESTRAIRTQLRKGRYCEHSPPIYLTSGYWFDDVDTMRACFADETDGYAYSRYSNPNTDEFAAKLASLENVDDGIATASGMAAVFASIMSVLNAGDHILATNSLFGSTHILLQKHLPRWGIETTFIDPVDSASWEQAVQPQTKMLFVETPTNPGLQFVDLQAASQLCKQHGLLFVVDNCFATPCLQQPQRFGADLIIHSATKFIDGQGRTTGGAILGSCDAVEPNYFFLRQTGATLSAFNAWLLARSIDTLPVRMQAHCSNALALASWLEKRSDVANVRYPFLPSHPQHDLAIAQMSAGGGLVCIDIPGKPENSIAFLDNLHTLTMSANLGDSRTIVTHPASTTHARLSPEERKQMGINDSTIRISVGLENIEDIQQLLDDALSSI